MELKKDEKSTIKENRMKLILNDCLLAMREIPDNSVDSIVTDPPYGLSFMGKAWDYDVPSVDIWKEALRVLKPGGYLLSFAGSRTYHRMAVNIEDAGFEIRDMIEWVYGSGFPKSYNIAKGLNKYLKTGNASWNGTGDSSGGALGYAKLQHKQGYRPNDYSNKHQNKNEITEPEAKKWNGWGTALKPAHEPIVMARKPLIGTVVENVMEYGTGGINIDGCRVEGEGYSYPNGCGGSHGSGEIYGTASDEMRKEPYKSNDLGRFPANLIHDGSDEVLAVFPNNSARFFKVCKDTQKHAIMKVWNDIDVSIAKSNSTITQVIEKIISITSALVSVPPNLDLLNQNLNALFVEKSADSIEIDFVAKLAAIEEIPEDLVSQEELQVIQDFITSSKNFTQTQKNVGVEKWENTDTIQIIINLLKLCGYVLRATDENTSSEKREAVVENGELSRFGYFPKASKSERNAGLEKLKDVEQPKIYAQDKWSKENMGNTPAVKREPVKNNHPTVKPIALMQYLVRLVTPPNGTVLDPFMGSGTTGIAAKREGFSFIGIEREPEYVEIARARIDSA